MPVVAFAEFNWGEGEAHYGDRHFYTVTAYAFDPKVHRYTRRIKYATSQKYSDGDGEKPLNVLESEKDMIVSKLTDVQQSKPVAENAPQVTPVPAAVQSPADPNAVNRRLAECILPEVQYGHYSSYDGGQSLIDLLQECPLETAAFGNQCEASGHSIEECTDRLASYMHAAIRKFGK